MRENAAIEVTALRKCYGAVPVLDGINFRVRTGSVFALLGPNGAGKTTTVRILATLVVPDGGSARIAGRDVVGERRLVRQRISLTGQYAALDGLQTGRENLEMMGRLRRLRPRAARTRASELLERFDLVDAADRRVAGYSGGMRRRLDLAASLVGNPEVIFLDEPTTGLDPRARQAVWEVVTGLAAGGVTVLLTTQYLDEAERLADSIAVLDAGRIVAEGSARDLKERVGGTRLDLQAADLPAFGALVDRLGSRAIHVDRSALKIGIPTDGSAPAARAVLDELDPDRVRIARFELRTASLDDVFMTLTGAGSRHARESEHANV